MKRVISILVYLICSNFIWAQIDSVKIIQESELEFPAEFLQLKSSIASRIDNRDNGYIYSANLVFGLGIYSISDISEIELIVDLEISSFNDLSVSTCQQAGDYLYVGLGDFQKENLATGLAIVDVVDPANPIILDIWSSTEFISGVSHLDIYDNIAYLSVMDDGLLILDVNNKSEIEFVSHYIPDLDFPEINEGHNQGRGITKVEETLYCAYDRGGFRAIDISDIYNPVEVQKYINEDLISKAVAAYNDVVVVGNYAFLSVDYCGLEVLDLSTTPWTVVEWYDPVDCAGFNWFGAELHANELITACNDSLLFMSGGNSEVVVFDISNPPETTKIGGFFELDNELAAYGLHVFEDRISVSYINNPLNIPFIGNWGGLKMLSYTKMRTTSMSEIENKNMNAIYPNPTNSKLYFNKQGLIEIEIFNVQGEFLMSKIMNLESNFVDVANLSEGTYILKMVSNNMSTVQKFIKH